VSRLTILLADDHPVLREGLKVLVNAQSDMEVIAEAEDGGDAWQKIIDFHPNVAVLDVSMPGLDGIKVTERVQARCPEVKILALTAYKDKGYLDQLLRAGASGYVLKGSRPEELMQAIRSVSIGQVYIDPEMTTEIVGRYARAQGARKVSQQGEITDREEQVLRLIAQGYSNKEIAGQLNISVKTVESHKAKVMEKLDLRSRAEMVRYALRQGWLQDS
jgi:DNA-binding NarL/FixJ family response regulator